MKRMYVQAPRIEIVLVPDQAEADPNKETTLFELWMILHLPDGEPATFRIDDGPYERGAAVSKMEAVWRSIGDRFAQPNAKLGTPDLQ